VFVGFFLCWVVVGIICGVGVGVLGFYPRDPSFSRALPSLTTDPFSSRETSCLPYNLYEGPLSSSGSLLAPPLIRCQEPGLSADFAPSIHFFRLGASDLSFQFHL